MRMRFTVICALISLTISAYAGNTDIHKMMVGSKVLEVVQTRQLTFREDGDVRSIALSPNGRYAVYLTIQPNMDSDARIGRLYLVRLSGGKPILLVEGGLPDNDYPDSYQWKLTNGFLPAQWSPDSRLIAIEASLKNDDDTAGDKDKNNKRKEAALFYDTAGSLISAYYSPKDSHIFPINWCHDSRNIALVCKSKDNEGNQNNTVVVHDVIGNQPKTLFRKKCRLLMFENWIENDKGLLYAESLGKGKFLYHKLYLDGSSPVEYEAEPDRYEFYKRYGIPFYIDTTEAGAEVKSIETGKTVCLVKGLESYEICAIPNTRFVAYKRDQTIQDGSDGLKTKLISIWLMYPEAEKQNRICVALDANFSGLSWSNNGLSLAYVSGNRAYATELTLRNATPREKLAAGIQLTEEEKKVLMLENAHQIADAIENSVFCSEYYPSQDDFMARIKSRLHYADTMFLPGTNKIAITYFKPDDKYNISNMPPPDTLIATLDSGYGWKYKIFADGHVEEALK